jgi:prostaglandin-endoperoxide synthase 2
MPSLSRIAFNLLSGYPRFWRFVSAVPLLRRWFNKLFINFIANSTKPRPHPLSLWGGKPSPSPCDDYVTWTGLVDRTYTGRHLPPETQAAVDALPPVSSLAGLFQRGDNMVPCPRSAALFGFFAQWFTDSFLRTDPNDLRKNTSNHEIDLCQIYGLCAADTELLRSKQYGELKTQTINGEVFPPYLFEPDGMRVKTEFRNLSYIDPDTGDYRNPVLDGGFNTPERKSKLFAAGLERANSTIFYSAINTIFVREHNRLCREMRQRYPNWDDNRLFETARNTNIVGLLKVIIEDYINHLAGTQFKLFVDVGFAEHQNWYRTNRICAEFDLLYRWHPLVPSTLSLAGATLPNNDFRFNNALLTDKGIETVIEAAASQRAGRIRLKNTAPFLVQADLAAMTKSRTWRLKPYNDYRERFGLSRVASFQELVGDPADPAFVRELEAAYGSVDRVDFLVGLFAEQRPAEAMLGDLMTLMVGVDAFSQALTNPLLSQNVYGEAAFSAVGMETIAATSSFADIVRRNTNVGSRKVSFAFDGSPARAAPGSYGPPLLKTAWDTLDFFLISGWEQFFRRRQRKHASTVFKVNLFKPTVAVLDHRAIVPLFADLDLIQDYGFSWAVPPLPLVGDVAPSIFESGPKHDRPKVLYMQILRQRAADLPKTFAAVLGEFTARWQSLRRFGWRDELEDFAVCFLFEWILGARPSPKDVRLIYNNIFTHIAVPIAKLLPWSAYSRSLVSYRRLLTFVKTAPRFADIMTLAHAEGLTDEDAVAKQITFLLGMNSFLGTQNLLKSIVGEMSLRPDLCAALRAEIATAVRPAAGEVDVPRLARLPMLDKALREILRLHPPVSFVFGRATRDRLIESKSGTFGIHAGELVMGVIPLAHLDDSVFARPEAFDPNRFDDPAASQHLIWPRGLHDADVSAQDRTCPGKDVAVLIAKLFCAALLPGFVWMLKEIPQWDRRRFSLNVAAPKGPLEVEFRAAP